MQLILHLNAGFQPKHRFELEDALQEIFQTNKAGEITGGGTLRKENGEIDRYIVFCNERKNEFLCFKLSLMSKMPIEQIA